MYRYIVAPGELILVSDNHGGVTRVTGTSFAAPLVTGAIALLQDRWPWLQQHAEETVQIILQSADDLGATGRRSSLWLGQARRAGIAIAAQFQQSRGLPAFTYSGRPAATPFLPNWSPAALKNSLLNTGQLNLWQQKGAYLVAFETIGTTFRDFDIPLSRPPDRQEPERQRDDESVPVLSLPAPGRLGARQEFAVLRLGVHPACPGRLEARHHHDGVHADETSRGEGPFHAEFVAANLEDGIELKLGEGSGAHAMFGEGAFALRSDFDPSTGGVNPVLGFASGGLYASGGYAITRDLKLDFGFSQKSDDHVYIDPTFGPAQGASVRDGARHGLRRGSRLRGREERHAQRRLYAPDGRRRSARRAGRRRALLRRRRAHGRHDRRAHHRALQWLDGVGSGTLAHTTAPQSALSSLSLAEGGLESTAYELVATKAGVLSERDSLRFSLTQPLHVESGALNYTSLEVVDRSTGSVGPVTQTWNVAGKREYRMETMYGITVLDGRGSVDGFAVAGPQSAQRARHGDRGFGRRANPDRYLTQAVAFEPATQFFGAR